MENIIAMIGCNKKEFGEIADKAIGDIRMSSGSWYADYILFDNKGLLAVYDSKGKLKFNRTTEKTNAVTLA